MGFGGGDSGPSEAELAARREDERAYNEEVRIKMRNEAAADEEKRKKEEDAERIARAEWASEEERKRIQAEQDAYEASLLGDADESKKAAVTTAEGGTFDSIQIPEGQRPV